MDNKDQAWWYRERPCVGFLAAAAWRIGGVCLEEWLTRKGPLRQCRYGRCDLYVCLERKQFFIEAKHTYSRATAVLGSELERLRVRLEKASDEAANLQCKDVEKLGV